MKNKILIGLSGIILLLVLSAYLPVANAASADAVGLSVYMINQDPDPATSGNTVDVRLGVVNLGGAQANNVIIEAVQDYPFTLVPGEDAQQKINVQGYQGQYDNSTKIVKYTMNVDKNTAAGTYSFKVKYYQEGSDSFIIQQIPIDVRSKVNAEVVVIDKTTLIPGTQTGLTFTVTNVGNSPLKDLAFSWDNTDKVLLPVGSDNTKYINYLDAGNSTDLEYQVIPDTNADPGLYQLNLHLSYQDPITNQQRNITTTAGIYVGGGTDFDVAFSESSSGATSFTVANIGSNPASSVSISIPPQKGWTVSGSNSMIIGNLNKGDYTVASFNLQSPATSNRTGMGARNFTGSAATGSRTGAPAQFNGNFPSNSTSDTVTMDIAYTNTMGQRQTVEKQVKVNLQGSSGSSTTALSRRTAQPSTFSKYKWYFVAVIVIILLIVGFRIYRNKKKNESASDSAESHKTKKR